MGRHFMVGFVSELEKLSWEPTVLPPWRPLPPDPGPWRPDAGAMRTPAQVPETETPKPSPAAKAKSKSKGHGDGGSAWPKGKSNWIRDKFGPAVAAQKPATPTPASDVPEPPKITGAPPQVGEAMKWVRNKMDQDTKARSHGWERTKAFVAPKWEESKQHGKAMLNLGTEVSKNPGRSFNEARQALDYIKGSPAPQTPKAPTNTPPKSEFPSETSYAEE